MKVAKSPTEELARTNCVFVRPGELDPRTKYILVEDAFAFSVL